MQLIWEWHLRWSDTTISFWRWRCEFQGYGKLSEWSLFLPLCFSLCEILYWLRIGQHPVLLAGLAPPERSALHSAEGLGPSFLFYVDFWSFVLFYMKNSELHRRFVSTTNKTKNVWQTREGIYSRGSHLIISGPLIFVFARTFASVQPHSWESHHMAFLPWLKSWCVSALGIASLGPCSLIGQKFWEAGDRSKPYPCAGCHAGSMAPVSPIPF